MNDAAATIFFALILKRSLSLPGLTGRPRPQGTGLSSAGNFVERHSKACVIRLVEATLVTTAQANCPDLGELCTIFGVTRTNAALSAKVTTDIAGRRYGEVYYRKHHVRIWPPGATAWRIYLDELDRACRPCRVNR